MSLQPKSKVAHDITNYWIQTVRCIKKAAGMKCLANVQESHSGGYADSAAKLTKRVINRHSESDVAKVRVPDQHIRHGGQQHAERNPVQNQNRAEIQRGGIWSECEYKEHIGGHIGRKSSQDHSARSEPLHKLDGCYDAKKC